VDQAVARWGELEVRFQWAEDRHRHTVLWHGPGGEGPVPLLRSVEGNPRQPWPPSPVIQHLVEHSEKLGRPLLLGLGMLAGSFGPGTGRALLGTGRPVQQPPAETRLQLRSARSLGTRVSPASAAATSRAPGPAAHHVASGGPGRFRCRHRHSTHPGRVRPPGPGKPGNRVSQHNHLGVPLAGAVVGTAGPRCKRTGNGKKRPPGRGSVPGGQAQAKALRLEQGATRSGRGYARGAAEEPHTAKGGEKREPRSVRLHRGSGGSKAGSA